MLHYRIYSFLRTEFSILEGVLRRFSFQGNETQFFANIWKVVLAAFASLLTTPLDNQSGEFLTLTSFLFRKIKNKEKLNRNFKNIFPYPLLVLSYLFRNLFKTLSNYSRL